MEQIKEENTTILLPTAPNTTLYLVHCEFIKKHIYGMCKEYEMSFIVEALSEHDAEKKLKSSFPRSEPIQHTTHSYLTEYVKTLYINEIIR